MPVNLARNLGNDGSRCEGIGSQWILTGYQCGAGTKKDRSEVQDLVPGGNSE